jgi:RluA family pseudouridine synthase
LKPKTFSTVRIVEPFPFTYSFRVKKDDAGLSILDFFVMRFPFRSREAWLEKVSTGFIKVNGDVVPDGFILREGMTVSHFNPRVTEPSVPDEIRILEEHPDYLAVFKPAPMPVHAGGRYYKNTLSSILSEKGFGDLHIVHRLDSVTSGIMLFARNASFARACQTAFSSEPVNKIYTALVSGVPESDTFECHLPIIRSSGYVFKTGDDTGKTALTRFKVLNRYTSHALVACYPVTGRTHQIRLHLQASGFPIADDPVYGPSPEKNPMQNRAISLRHVALEIPSLSINLSLPPDDWNYALNPV